MHTIEPHYNWRIYYVAEEDDLSPMFGKTYSEFEYSNTIYNFLIHPQWDEFGSTTLYLKLIFVDYDEGVAIIEFIGEWNDCIDNDIAMLKRYVLNQLNANHINKFIFIGENVLNFHYDCDDYYEEIFGELEDGWIAAVNFQPHVLDEMKKCNLDYYINFGGELDDLDWRTMQPLNFYEKVFGLIQKRLNI
jgi:hypothetical protein